MTDEEQVSQALAELWDIVKCRCHEAYTGRGLHDPDCDCDSTDAVQTVTNAIAALTEQLAAARRDAEEAEAYAGELEAKLAKAVEAERERCAKIADKCKRENGPLSKKGFNEQYRRGLEAAGQAIAAAIRAELTGGKDE